MNAGQRTSLIVVSVIAVTVVLLGLLPVPEPVEEARCTLSPRTVGKPVELCAAAFRYMAEPSSDASDAPNLPAGFGQSVVYHLPTGTGDVVYAVSVASPWQLVIDTNRDGVLADEKPLTAQPFEMAGWPTEPNIAFGPVTLASPDSERAVDVSVYLLCLPDALYADGRPGPMAVFPARCLVGELAIGGATYEVGIVDGDYDGRFTVVDPGHRDWMGRVVGDFFAIDLDGDGQFQTGTGKDGEITPLSRMVLVGNTYYAIDIAADGARLELTETRPAIGELLIESVGDGLKLGLWSDTAGQLVVEQPRRFELPVGTYEIVDLRLEARDIADDLWTLSTSSVGEAGRFDIQAEGSTSLALGPPLTIRTDLRRDDAQTVSINFTLEGQAGETYRITNLRRNGKVLDRPEFRIVDEEGTILTNGTFEYG